MPSDDCTISRHPALKTSARYSAVTIRVLRPPFSEPVERHSIGHNRFSSCVSHALEKCVLSISLRIPILMKSWGSVTTSLPLLYPKGQSHFVTYMGSDRLVGRETKISLSLHSDKAGRSQVKEKNWPFILHFAACCCPEVAALQGVRRKSNPILRIGCRKHRQDPTLHR